MTPDDENDYDDELLLSYNWLTKGIEPNFQLEVVRDLHYLESLTQREQGLNLHQNWCQV